MGRGVCEDGAGWWGEGGVVRQLNRLSVKL